MLKVTGSQINNLDRVALTFINELKDIGVYQYNKYVYLFEYFFIKNFGIRYTKEVFVKLTHGPVITNYKQQILKLHNLNLLKTDIKELKGNNRSDDDFNERIPIEATEQTNKEIVIDTAAYNLIKQIINKFSKMNLKELEDYVYETQPVKNYMDKFEKGFKNKTGGKILKDCVRFKDYDNAKVRGNKLAFEHLRKYPNINVEQHKKLVEEFKPLIELRPRWEY